MTSAINSKEKQGRNETLEQFKNIKSHQVETFNLIDFFHDDRLTCRENTYRKFDC